MGPVLTLGLWIINLGQFFHDIITGVKVINDFPPNISLIRTYLNPPPGTIFCYGDTIYNPTENKITEDLLAHEEVHTKQQGDSPEAWWQRYLIDPEFRLSQEVEAYAAQYNFVRKRAPNEIAKIALDEFSTTLAGPMYGLIINKHQAESLIRHKAKEL